MSLRMLTVADRARVEHAVADYAGGCLHNPLRLSNDQVVWCLVDGHLEPLIDEYGRDAMFDAVQEALQAAIAADPATSRPLSSAEVRQRERARAERADQIISEAKAACRAGRYGFALDLIDRAELAAPDHRPDGASYRLLRERVYSLWDRAAREV